MAENFVSNSNASDLMHGIANKIGSLMNSLDSWTATAQVDSNNVVTFTGLSDNLGYTLYCEDSLIGIASMSKTGSGDNVTIAYTVTGADVGAVCKLRIVR